MSLWRDIWPSYIFEEKIQIWYKVIWGKKPSTSHSNTICEPLNHGVWGSSLDLVRIVVLLHELTQFYNLAHSVQISTRVYKRYIITHVKLFRVNYCVAYLSEHMQGSGRISPYGCPVWEISWIMMALEGASNSKVGRSGSATFLPNWTNRSKKQRRQFNPKTWWSINILLLYLLRFDGIGTLRDWETAITKLKVPILTTATKSLGKANVNWKLKTVQTISRHAAQYFIRYE